MNTPYQAPAAPPPPQKDPSRGSLLVGFLLGWAVLIGAYVLMAIFYATLAGIGSSGALGGLLGLSAGTLPWVGLLGLIVYFAVQNKPRSAPGVVLAIASMVGVAILLVAACFGLLATNGSWH